MKPPPRDPGDLIARLQPKTPRIAMLQARRRAGCHSVVPQCSAVVEQPVLARRTIVIDVHVSYGRLPVSSTTQVVAACASVAIHRPTDMHRASAAIPARCHRRTNALPAALPPLAIH